MGRPGGRRQQAGTPRRPRIAATKAFANRVCAHSAAARGAAARSSETGLRSKLRAALRPPALTAEQHAASPPVPSLPSPPQAARGPAPLRSAARCRGAPGAAAPLPPRGYTTAPGGRGAAGPRAATLRNRRSPDPVPLRSSPRRPPRDPAPAARGRGRYLS